MESKFNLLINYWQVAVFNPYLEQPFNDWEEEHFHQGFVWRKQSVSFRTPVREGRTEIRVCLTEAATVRDDAVVAISVPFHLPEQGAEVATVGEGQVVDVPAGDYELLFQAGPGGNQAWVEFHFVPRQISTATIHRGAGTLLNPPAELNMTGKPA